jgi:hypothetical protein
VSFFAIFAIFAVFAVGASAQTKPTQRPAPRGPSVPHWDLSVGAGFFSGSGLGSADADLRGRGDQPFQLFATTSRIGASLPLEVRLGYRLSPRYSLEMRGSWSRPELQTSIAGDVEGAPALTVAENVDLYALDLGLVMTFNRSRQPRALTPFISAGAGYVGAVHEGLTLLENGFSVRGGGGVKYPLDVRNQKRIKAVGVRADGALAVLSGGLVSGSGPTPQVAASGSFYLTF